MQEEFLENEAKTVNFKDKRKELENLITVNSCLIDLLKDACEFNMEFKYSFGFICNFRKTNRIFETCSWFE